MKNYDVALDLQRILDYFELTQAELAERIGISRMSLSRYLKGATYPDKRALEAIYSFAYEERLYLNAAKADFFHEDKKGNALLFHGATGDIVGEVDNKHSKLPNDFGYGFYAGESLVQSASWVSEAESGSIYCFYFDGANLKKLEFQSDRRWMYAILYYRGAFRYFAPTKEVEELIEEIEGCDYLIAPIADNQMYQILNRFADNEITDEQCIHALATTNLGLQHVFKSMEACKKLVCLERLFLCKQEKRDYLERKKSLASESASKAELAMIEYRRKGKYFDELFKRIG